MILKEHIHNFIDYIKSSDTVLYNEAGLQHELGFYLRTKLGEAYLIQLERNIDAVLGKKDGFVKSGMDIYLQDKSSMLKIEILHRIEGPEQYADSE